MLLAWMGIRYPDSSPGGSLYTATLPFVGLAIAGWYCLKGNPKGVILSLVLQAAQICTISIESFVWQLSGGFYLSLGLSSSKLNLFAGWNTSFLLGFHASGQPAAFAVNLIPLAIVVLLIRSRSATEDLPHPRPEQELP